MWHGSHWAPSSYGFLAVGSDPAVLLLPEGDSLLMSYIKKHKQVIRPQLAHAAV